MKLFKLKSELRSYLNNIRDDHIVALVPTMGSLHSGHVSLINNAMINADIVVCSIFVNRMQFNNQDDFLHYPRTNNEDIRKLTEIGCDILYMPDELDLFSLEEDPKEFDFNQIDKYMEGAFREGHFTGVATVVEKLIDIVNPEKAFFGEKDLQQLQIIRHVMRNSKTNIIASPTVREKSGVAMSSRNNLLSSEELKEASLLYKSLKYVQLNYKTRSVFEIKNKIKSQFRLQSNLDLEYFEIVSLETLHPIELFLEKDNNAACIAASIRGVRLIDNIIF